MNSHGFLTDLEKRLAQEMPGKHAHLEMASMFREENYDIPEAHKKSGVLTLLYPHSEALHIVFMKRTLSGGIHSGQISFPGGRKEEEDSDLTQTALREAQEELAVPSEQVHVLGTLSELYIPRSNFLVLPSVGFLEDRPNFQKAEREVAEIIEVPLQVLLMESTRTQVQTLREGKKVVVPSYFFKGHVIWGATAMMLNEFLMVTKPIWEKHQNDTLPS